jgi:hypothetical protein
LAGAAMASAGWIGGSRSRAEASVHGAVYGGAPCCEPTVATIAELRAMTGPSAQAVHVLGYYAANDGGGGLFYWDASSAAVDNGGTVIQSTAAAAGRWLRIV